MVHLANRSSLGCIQTRTEIAVLEAHQSKFPSDIGLSCLSLFRCETLKRYLAVRLVSELHICVPGQHIPTLYFSHLTPCSCTAKETIFCEADDRPRYPPFLDPPGSACTTRFAEEKLTTLCFTLLLPSAFTSRAGRLGLWRRNTLC